MTKQTQITGVADLLLRFYEENDEKALSEFFIIFKDIVFNVSFSVLGNLADTEDITQQIFFLVMKKTSICKAAYEGDDQKVKSWLLTVTYNACRMQYNANKKKAKYEITLGNEVEEQKKDTDEQMNAESDILEKVNHAIFELPEKYRTPILMRYQQEMSVQEISDILASPQATIRSILSRGVSQLRGKLAGQAIVVSSLAVIKYIAQIEFPTNKSDLTISMISSAKNTNLHVQKAFQATEKSVSPIASWGVKMGSIVALAGFATSLYLFSPLNSAPNTPFISQQQATITAPQIEKNTWDFSKDDASDLVAVNKSFVRDSAKKTIYDVAGIPSDVQKEPTVIKLPKQVTKPIKVVIQSTMLSSRSSDAPFHSSLEYVPCTDQKKIYQRSTLYNLPYPISAKYKNNSLDYPTHGQTAYVFDDICIMKTFDNSIRKIHRYNLENGAHYVGLLLDNYSVEKITIHDLDDEEAKSIRDEAFRLLTEGQKK